MREDPDVTQEERDAMALRCGLLPLDRFIKELRPTLRRDLPAHRATGHTTQQMLSALVRAERGEGSLFLGRLTWREHAQQELLSMAHSAGLPAFRMQMVRFAASGDDRLTLGFRGWVAHL